MESDYIDLPTVIFEISIETLQKKVNKRFKLTDEAILAYFNMENTFSLHCGEFKVRKYEEDEQWKLDLPVDGPRFYPCKKKHYSLAGSIALCVLSMNNFELAKKLLTKFLCRDKMAILVMAEIYHGANAKGILEIIDYFGLDTGLFSDMKKQYS
jgi:hypothetical protein